MPKQGKRGKSPHNGPHGDARKAITTRNKMRRAKKQSRIATKRADPERVARLETARLQRQANRKAARLARIKDFRSKKNQIETNNEKENVPTPEVELSSQVTAG